ncbi:MAG TPA: 5'-3' exonuclease [Noviherbaspirillum sp.]
MNGLFLAIDGLSILRRVFQAAKDEPDLEKRADEAISSSCRTFRRVLHALAPSHVLTAFDAGGHTWRHDIYPRYRERRQPMPEQLHARLPNMMAQLQAMGVHCVQIPEVEAEDVIATAVMRWLGKGYGQAVVATTDKDLLQLTDAGVSIYHPFDNERRDAAWVEQKFGVPAALLGDYLALVGDSADDVPGVPGIGAKKAAELLRRYGSLDGVFSGAGILLDTVGRNLRKGKSDALISRQLVALKTDAVLGLTWKQLAYTSEAST